MAAGDSRYKWRLVAFLFVAAGLNYGDRTATSSVFPLLRSDLGMSDLQLAALGSLFLWTYAIGSPFAGFFADRFSRSRIVTLSLAGWSLVTLATGFAPDSTFLLATRVLLGVAECFYLPAAIALIADHHGTETRATAMAMHVAGLSAGLIAGGALAGFLGEQYGWRLSFLVLGLAGLALAAAAPFLLRDEPTVRETRRLGAAAPSALSNIAILVRIPSFWILLLEAMTASIGTWIFFNWLPLYFNEVYHLSLAGAGFSAPLALQGAGVAGLAIGGWLSDRWAGRYPGRRMLVQGLFFIAAAPCLLVFGWKPAFPLLISCVMAYSLLRALGAAGESAMMCDLLAPKLRSTAVGVTNATNTFAGGIGVLVAGYLKRDYGLAGVFQGIAVIMAIAAGMLLIGYFFFVRRDLRRFREENDRQLAAAGAI